MPATLSVFSSFVKSCRKISDRYPVTRGMLTYLALWPAGNLVQQTLDKSRPWWDLQEAARYGLYGCLVNAPLIHTWLRLLTKAIPGSAVYQAVMKGYIDQLVFAPINITQFFVGMALLEGRPLDDALQNWREKILSTWMISLSVWPIFQTINFSLVPAKNQVMFVSLGSLLWLVFLSYMHHTHPDDLPEGLHIRRIHYDYKHGSNETILKKPNHSIDTKGWNPILPVTALCCGREEDGQDWEVVTVKTQ